MRVLRRRGVRLSPRAAYWLGWAETLAEVGVIFWFTITFVTVRMTVPTGSMNPAIAPGDSFFVDIVSYHFRDPSPGRVIVFWQLEELQVTAVTPGSPAARAGLQPGGLDHPLSVPHDRHRRRLRACGAHRQPASRGRPRTGAPVHRAARRDWTPRFVRGRTRRRD
ncbi:TPA: hypothetical protein DCY65_00905 [Candidatus Acetothermia bacterium]|nr:hypothetical protein [Candidatus Acetothermia bacterium]